MSFTEIRFFGGWLISKSGVLCETDTESEPEDTEHTEF